MTSECPAGCDEGVRVLDLVYIGVTVVVFAALLLLLKGIERVGR